VIIDRYLVRHFLPVFFIGLSMFVSLILLIDLFVNLVIYLNYEATFKQIMTVSYYYIPKAVEFAIPVSLLFAVAYSLGDLYARNELTSIITSGISFWRVGSSLMIIGLLMSVFSFFFDDQVVIPTLKIKNELSRALKHQQNTDANANVVIKVNNGKRIYAVDYYDYENLTLNGVIVVETDDEWNYVSQIRAQLATWNNERWDFVNAVHYKWEGDLLRVYPYTQTNNFTEDPELFRRSAVDPADLNVTDAKYLIYDLKTVGLPYINAESDYYHRFSFPLTSFIVIILSLSVAGRFRKNIMLMSLLVSLGISVIYYVIEMISMMMARIGTIPPIAGGWAPVIFFMFVGATLIRFSKT
jgi:lipopolysaccharide export system permease protein